MTRSFPLIAALAALPACGSVVPTTLLELNRLDTFTSDPAGFAVGVEAPEGLGLVEGSVVWSFGATHSPSGETRTLEMVLEEERAQEGLVIYRLSTADVDRLRAWQAALLPWKETSDGNSSLSLSVGAKGCRVPGVPIAADPRITISLQLAEGAPLRPLVRGAPILEFLDGDRSDIEALPLCEA